jgi:hypothetical protein
MNNTDLLLKALRDHIGKSNGITAKALVAEINNASPIKPEIPLTERELRHLVQELRKQGHHVCAHPRDGYFIAQSPEELQGCLDYLTHRAMCSFEQIAAMKRVSMHDLFGQLRLPT